MKQNFMSTCRVSKMHKLSHGKFQQQPLSQKRTNTQKRLFELLFQYYKNWNRSYLYFKTDENWRNKKILNTVRGDISRGIYGLNIRAMISLGTRDIFSLAGRRTERSVEVNEEIVWNNISQILQ